MPTPLLNHVSPVDDTMLDEDSEADLLDHTGARGILCPFGAKSYAELSDNALDAIVSLFQGDAGPLDAFPGASFMIDALMDDADFPQTYSELEAAVVAGTLDRDGLLDILVKAVPPVPGSHTSVLDHHWLWHHLEALLT